MVKSLGGGREILMRKEFSLNDLIIKMYLLQGSQASIRNPGLPEGGFMGKIVKSFNGLKLTPIFTQL